MTWLATTPELQREQFGRFLLGTGNFGGMATTSTPGAGLSEQEGVALIERAVRDGFRVVDTSDVYSGGESERIVGVWNRGHPDDAGVLVQTKTGVTRDGANLDPARVAQQLQHSLDTIGRVDLFLAHRVDPATPWSRSLPVFSQAVESGRIRAYGLSNVGADALTEALETADRLGLARPEVIQNSYSLLVRDDEAEVLPIVAEQGLAYTPYSPLSYGILAGRYRHGDKPAAGSRASTGPRAEGLLNDPAVMRKVESFGDLAERLEISPAGLALGWLINRPAVTAPIVGIGKESHWRGPQEAIALAWTDRVEGELDAIFRSS